ncbi:hypothetical protein [Streptomyces sp. NPDC050534]|uniref:hypothetical protein n=1 Tax=Streptomyces sp. NPDC050534 TaxID=3365625 RepID=UPI003796CDE5
MSIRRQTHHRHRTAETVTDPVCGTRISRYGAPAHRGAEGHTRHFHSAQCASTSGTGTARSTAKAP